MTLTNTPNPVDAALVALLAADDDPQDGFATLVPGGAWHLVAPDDAADPYMVFGLTAPSVDTYTMGGLAYSTMIYGLDVIQAGLSAERAQTAAQRLYDLLTDGEVALSALMDGWEVMAIRRIGYMERLERIEGGPIRQHIQSLFSIGIQPA